MEKRIKELMTESGADVCGIAHIDRFTDAPTGFHPRDIYEQCRAVIVFAKRMPRGTAQVNPRMIYNHANNLNIVEVDRITYEACLRLEQEFNCTMVPLPSDSPYEYWDQETLTGKGVLSMRHAAMLAGLGSLGKNTLLINKKYGNFITLGGILTDVGLQSDELSEELCLPNCGLCIQHCPTKALDGKTTQQSLCRPHTYGVNARGFEVVNCNRCRTVCPRAFGVK